MPETSARQFDVHRALQSGQPFTLTLSGASVVREGPDTDADDVATRQAPASSASAPVAPPPRPKIPTSGPSPAPGRPALEGYDIQELLGSGGMGTVYRAYDRERRRPVALKVMNRAGAAAILRFKHEFRTLLGVAHPNLVTLYELISDGQSWFLTMELLDGVNFLQYVREEAPPTTRPGDPVAAAGDDASAGDTWVVDQSQPRRSVARTRPVTPGQRVRFARRLASSPRGSHGSTRRGSCTATSSRRT